VDKLFIILLILAVKILEIISDFIRINKNFKEVKSLINIYKEKIL